jgi:phage tail-like protein
LRYLPGIYHTDFVKRFLGMFESILTPLEWNVDNFDLYLDPSTAPIGFLPWLANWFEITFDSTWSEAQRRSFLKDAHRIYARRGTRWALSRVLEIYTGQVPEIVDLAKDLAPFTFKVKLPLGGHDLDPDLIGAIIDANKPGHTTYILEFTGR